jgi:hypothetical protein
VRSYGLARAASVSAFALLWASPTFAQSDADRASARAAAQEGLKAFQEGRFQDAADLCARAEAFMHAPTHLLLLARAQTKLGHLVEAQEAYFRIKREHLPPDAPRPWVEAQMAASDEQNALAPRIPTLKVTVEGAAVKDVALTIDGQPVKSELIGLARPVNPGQHTLLARAPSAESDPANVMMREGGAQALTLTLHPVAVTSTPAASPPEPSAGPAPPAATATAPPQTEGSGGSTGMRVGGWIGVGLGVVGAALGTVFLLKHQSDQHDADGLCTPKDANGDCPGSNRSQIANLDSSASSAATIAWDSYGVGAAALGTGVVMLVMSGGKGAPQTTGSSRVMPWVGATSAGVTVRF